MHNWLSDLGRKLFPWTASRISTHLVDNRIPRAPTARQLRLIERAMSISVNVVEHPEAELHFRFIEPRVVNT